MRGYLNELQTPGGVPGNHAGRRAIMLSAGQTLRLALLLTRHGIRLVQATAVHGMAVALNQFAAATG